MAEMKHCTRGDKCVHPNGSWLPATSEYFGPNAQSKDGLRGTCKVCCAKSSLESYYRRKRGEVLEDTRRKVVDGVLFKRCSRNEECVHLDGPWLPVTEENFNRAKGRWKDGLYPQCKACIAARKKQYHKKNRETILKKAHERYTNDPSTRAKRSKYHKRHYTEHREYYTERVTQWRLDNPEKSRGYKRKYRDKNPDYHRLHYQENPSVYRANAQRRRARKQALPVNFTALDWQRCLDYWNHCCCICGRPAGLWHRIVPDHWIPISDSRSDNPGTVAWNIVPMCHAIKGGSGSCNLEKRNHDPIEWLTQKLGEKAAKQKLIEIEAYFEWVREQGGE